jgi:lycopene cyclase domain-containing protein
MTYFGFLGAFVGIPLAGLLLLTLADQRRGLKPPIRFQTWPAWLVLGSHIIIAVVYTTPWDNYLVATGVWWYDPALVTGLTLGWVPIEEYTFFIVQTGLTGLWLLWLIRHLPMDQPASGAPAQIRYVPRLGWLALMSLWLGAILTLVSGWQPGTYLALELSWALPPLMIQLAFGGDILWQQRRLVSLAILVPTLYLSIADSIAITAGTWTINPAQSLNILLAGQLPLEEFIFFLLTNSLLVFGMILALAQESMTRLNFKRYWPKSVSAAAIPDKAAPSTLGPPKASPAKTSGGSRSARR